MDWRQGNPNTQGGREAHKLPGATRAAVGLYLDLFTHESWSQSGG